MRKVLAVASVGTEHKELVFKELKKIFRRIKISLDVLLQEEAANSATSLIENGNVFRSYPYITLTIPNYEQHRQYLQKAYKNNVLFSKFILLISEGNDYDELIHNRNEEILKRQCRNWNNSVSCTFDSTPVFTNIEEQLTKVERVLGQMDIRGKITEIEAQKKFHLIEDHRRQIPDDPKPSSDVKVPSKAALLKLFFGLEVGCGGKTRCGRGAATATATAYNGYSYSNLEFMDYEEDEKMMDENEETQDIPIQIQQIPIIPNGTSSTRRSSHCSSGKLGWNKRQAKSRLEQSLAPLPKLNPYLKKTYHHQVELSDLS